MDHTLQENIDMMKTPERWPLFPFLCLKHRTRRHKDSPFPIHATIFATNPLHVWELSYYELFEKMNDPSSLDSVTSMEYVSTEAMAEEWEVD